MESSELLWILNLFSSSSDANACLHVVQCLSSRSLPSLTPKTCEDRTIGYKAIFSRQTTEDTEKVN